jgi:uncharacterized membrane protein
MPGRAQALSRISHWCLSESVADLTACQHSNFSLGFDPFMKLIVQRARASARMSDERFFLALLIVMAATAAAVVTSFALVLHRNFLTIACDTAVLQNGIVNTMHGNWFSNNGSGGPNILASHTTFLLLLLIPFYVLFPSADTLFTLQVWGVFSTVIPLYLVALDLTRRTYLAFGVAVVALASPILLHMAVAPFHLETWIAAASLWSYFFYRRNNITGFCVSMGVAVCCGEQAALIFIALGASFLLIEDGLAWRRRYGLVALLGGLAWIILAVTVVAPLARGSSSFNIYAYNYTQWGIHSASGLPTAVAHRPFEALQFLANPYRWDRLAVLVGLPLLLAFASWRSLILLAPFPAYFLMCNQEFYLYFHAYYFSFAFVAGYLGLIFFLARSETIDRLGMVVLAGTFFLNVLLLCGTAGFYIQATLYRDDDFSATLHQEFDTIPTTATVYSPHRYSAYLSNRVNMVMGDLRDKNLDFDAMLNARFAETNVHPEQIDYIVCDFLNDQCGGRQTGYDPNMAKRRAENVDHLLESGQWQTFWLQNNVIILKRTGK